MTISAMTQDLHVGDTVTMTLSDHTGATVTAKVREARAVPAVPGPGGREAAQLVRVSNRSDWFDAGTGRGYNRPSLQIARIENA